MSKEKFLEIASGYLFSENSDKELYIVTKGKSDIKNAECNVRWGIGNLEILKKIDAIQDEEELRDAMENLQTEHLHWNWMAKSLFYKEPDYIWFYLYTSEIPQAICIIYQPKGSALNAKHNIFYVEYLAVAPWNINYSFQKRKFSKVGTILLKQVLQYCISDLGLKLGFCLHSLPQAKYYYEKILMENVQYLDKDKLIYYEMSEENAKKLLEMI